MDNQDIIKLLNKYNQGQCTEQEKAWIETWYLNQQTKPLNHPIEELARDLDEVEQKLIEHTTIRRITLWPRIAAAASILFFLSIGGYFLLHKQAPQQIAQNQIHNNIVPGGNKAIITLSNGKQVSLTDAKIGTISREGDEIIKKTGDGTVSYENNGSSGSDHQLDYNTITTPRGGQWSLTLPDGTKAILDAASSIKYPVNFIGHERKVEITGQVYFEVVHDAAKPFRVMTKGQVIEDIGTKFNVYAYDDEPFIKTTLVDGSVKISIPGTPSLLESAKVILKPGQQTVLQNNKLTVSDANIEEVLAWKNGYFRFNDENIESIMRKLSRWYNIEVEYKGDLLDKKFEGEIPRKTELSQVLKVLELANVHFTVEGKKIIVMQ
jgi:transmembrane sensor